MTNDVIPKDDDAIDAVVEKLKDLQTPGFEAEFDPDEAERAAAFVEDALSADDAKESALDMAIEEPAFLDDDGPSDELPPFVTVTNIRELYDWKPGESLDEALARKAKGDDAWR